MKKKKIGVWCGLIVIFLLVTSFLFLNKSPEKIFISTIKNIYKKVNNVIDKSDFNDLSKLTNNPFSLTGNLNFKTTMDLGGFEKLSKYNYGFSIGLDIPNKLANIKLNVKEDNNPFLTGNIAFQDNLAYAKLPELLDKTLELGDLDFFDTEVINTNYNKEDVETLLKDTLEYFLKTLDTSKLTVNKNVSFEYNGKQAKTEQIIYNLDKDNQKRTIEAMANEMLNNNDYLNRLAKVTNESVEDIRISLEELKTNFEYESDILLMITTEGLLKKVIEYDIILDEHAIKYVNYNNKKSIYIDDAILTITEITKESIKLEYAYEKLKGIIYLNRKKENDNLYATSFTITAKGNYENNDIDFEVNISESENLNDTSITKINVSDSKKIEALTNEELTQLYTNLQTKLKETPFASLLFGTL